MALKAKEIAAMIGVSQASLSLVVNNRPGLSLQTRNRIISELNEKGLDYILRRRDTESGPAAPEETGQAPEKPAEKSRSIGFVTYRVGGKLLGYNSFLPLIIENLEIRARKYGYSLSYIPVSREEIRNGLRSVEESNCAGFVVFATEMKERDLEYFERLGVPFVLLDNYFSLHDVNSVKVNNEQGTMIAVDYLRKKGHSSIGYIRSEVGINSFQERYESALRAMRENGIEKPERYVYTIRYGMDESYEDMKKILKREKDFPTALMVDNDLIAAGAMKAFKEAGYRVPEDISFVGFDDRPVCLMTEPKLTTIRIPRDYFGSEAVEVLVRILNGEKSMRVKTEISTRLIERDSVADLTEGADNGENDIVKLF